MPCVNCGVLTEWFNVETLDFLCAQECKESIIHSTKEIRRRASVFRCSKEGDQRCHLFGLNAAKVIFNYYATVYCQALDQATLEELIEVINEESNLYCCSAEQNKKDKETEQMLLDVFIYKTREYKSLSDETKLMYYQLRAVFYEIQAYHYSSLIERILQDFEEIRLKSDK